ncbi:MAG: UDP-N-acetylmuramyl-tripeptide synthetase [Patescibacteria group bacterium]
MFKRAIKAVIPRSFLSAYHKTLAMLANAIYRFPSRQMVVIGVTGTKGKSSTVIMLTRILEEAGLAVGSMNSVFFKVKTREWPNNKKQGMLGRFALQRMLRQMADKQCSHAVVEVTSEGVAQHRHWGIAFDVLIFTNLSPEHIESHGSYEKYRAAKQLVFKQLSKMRRKTLGAHEVKKVVIANAEDAEAAQFLKFKADEKWSVSCDPACIPVLKNNFETHLCADEVRDTERGASISLEGHFIQLPFHGAFMARNALLAIAAGRSLGVQLTACEEALEHMEPIPGRVEMLTTASGATVIIDYAHEPLSFEAILSLGRERAGSHRVITVFGATGGGRDTAKRPVMGGLAAAYSDHIILTTDDPYDDDPQGIIDDILPGVLAKRGWREGKNVESIVSREHAIKRSLSLAASGDVVLLLGKGSEPIMAVGRGKHIPWSDRAAVEKAEHNRA